MDNREISRYRRDGEDRFDNFGGYEDPNDYEEVYEYVEEEDDYDNYGGNHIGKLDPNDTTYTFVITNSSQEDKDVVLFGANEGLQPPEGVTIDVAESSHNEVREESKANPFTIVGMRMFVSDSAQFDNVLKLYEKTSSGRLTTYVKQPRNYQSPANQDKNLIHALDFTFEVTGKSSIRLKVIPGKTTFTFNVSHRTNIGNVLKGKSVAEVNTRPQATGLPQFDIMRLKEESKPAQPKLRKVIVRKPKRLPPQQESSREDIPRIERENSRFRRWAG